jgi:hypothetical protein
MENIDTAEDQKELRRASRGEIHRGVEDENNTLGPGVTKRCRLSWLTYSALVYESKCWGRGVAGFQPMSTAVHMEPK